MILNCDISQDFQAIYGIPLDSEIKIMTSEDYRIRHENAKRNSMLRKEEFDKAEYIRKVKATPEMYGKSYK